MASIADLRARLKKASVQPTKPRVSTRTAIDLILKLNRENRINPSLVFTTDGQEVLTQKIIDQEILNYLQDEGRARVSEIARALNLGPETVEARCKQISSLTMYLDEVITPDWFVGRSADVAHWLDREGELSYAKISDKLGLSLDLVKTRIIPKTAINSSHSVISPKFIQLVKARTRGLVRALTTPREVKEISAAVGGEQTTVTRMILEILAQESLGELGNDGLYVPHSWAKLQGEKALASWNENEWCEIDALKLAIGRTGVSEWMSRQGLKEGHNCLICGSRYLIRIDGKLQNLFHEAERHLSRICTSELLDGLGVPRDISAHDLERIASLLLKGSPEWNISGETMYSQKYLNSVMWDLDIKQILIYEEENLDKATESLLNQASIILEEEYCVRPPRLVADIVSSLEAMIRAELKKELQLLEQARLKPSIKHDLDSLVSIEERIIDSIYALAESQEGINRCGIPSAALSSEIHRTLLKPLINDVFKYTGVRLCGFDLTVAVESESDRSSILKSVPNSISSDDVKNALRRMERISAKVSTNELREILSELSIVVPKSIPKKKSINKRKHVELLKESVASAVGDKSLMQWALSFAAFVSSGKRVALFDDFTPVEVLRVIVDTLTNGPADLMSLLRIACDSVCRDQPISVPTRDGIKNFISEYDN